MLSEKDFKIKTQDGACAKIEFKGKTNNILFFDFIYESEEEKIPEKVDVFFAFPSSRVHSFWSPVNQLDRGLALSCYGNYSESRLAYGAPIFSAISQAGENVLTVAISDAKTPIEIKGSIDEFTADVSYRISFFTIQIAPVSQYRATIRIDLGNIPYYEAIKNVNAWWETDCGYTPAPVPTDAKKAVYSSWYTFHKDLKTETILKQCRAAKPLGMDVVIFDDGWQTEEVEGGGYKRCGEWKVVSSKIPDMKALVDEVHKIGMKFMLWYSVPFLGEESPLWERFSDMTLDTSERGWACLDPRYPVVREYLINIYETAAKEWGLDGFKLDFIDAFRLCDHSKNYDERRDFVSVEDAVHRLLIDVMKRLRAINPDMLFEFRQAYIGPAVKTFGNMIRVSDCPNDALINRVGIGDLRLTSGSTAVHGDMLMWHKDDTPASAAKQIIAVLYGVPQISVDLSTISDKHFKMIRFYLDFWNKNRDALIDGEFIPLNPECGYSAFIGKTENKVIATAYNTSLLSLSCTENEIVLINGTGSRGIVLECEKPFSANVEVFDCMGNLLSQTRTDFAALTKLDIPVSGLAKIVK